MNIAPEPLALQHHGPKSHSVRSMFAFRHRGAIGVVLLVPVGVATLFSTPTTDENSSVGLLLTAIGWLAFLSYAAMRIWATLYVGGRKDRELQTEGPYSLCRNPLYLGSFAFALAIACLLKSVVFGVVLLPAFLIYLQFVVRAEEHFLELRFTEDYRNYCRRTPRFLPRWSAFHTPASVCVNVKRLKAEFIRLGSASLLMVSLQAAVLMRNSPAWPHWFPLF